MHRSRKRSDLRPAMNHLLDAYALAAGVSLLALARPAEAEIIYTPVNATVSRNGSYNLDLNNDGTVDFVVVESVLFRNFHSSTQNLFVSVAEEGNHVQCIPFACYSSNSYVAGVLERGSSIDSRGPWVVNPVAFMARRNLNRSGTISGFAWPNQRQQYLGLEFRIHGEAHFGWARLSVTFHNGLPKARSWEARITGYAYETIPNKPIRAGQTKDDDEAAATPRTSGPYSYFVALGALALGSDGIALWRRSEDHPNHEQANWFSK